MSYIIALHIIFVICWFAPLFYMPRLLIYHTEASQKPEPDRSILGNQFKIMQKRLWYGIAWPSMILTYIFGFWTSFMNFDYYYQQPWFYLKAVFVFALTLYHLYTHVMFKRQQNDIFRWTSTQLRLWNEVATILLFAIVFLVVPKQNTAWVWGTLGIIILSAAIYAAVLIYKRSRDKEILAQKESDDNDELTPPPVPPAVS